MKSIACFTIAMLFAGGIARADIYRQPGICLAEVNPYLEGPFDEPGQPCPNDIHGSGDLSSTQWPVGCLPAVPELGIEERCLEIGPNTGPEVVLETDSDRPVEYMAEFFRLQNALITFGSLWSGHIRGGYPKSAYDRTNSLDYGQVFEAVQIAASPLQPAPYHLDAAGAPVYEQPRWALHGPAVRKSRDADAFCRVDRRDNSPQARSCRSFYTQVLLYVPDGLLGEATAECRGADGVWQSPSTSKWAADFRRARSVENAWAVDFVRGPNVPGPWKPNAQCSTRYCGYGLSPDQVDAIFRTLRRQEQPAFDDLECGRPIVCGQYRPEQLP